MSPIAAVAAQAYSALDKTAQVRALLGEAAEALIEVVPALALAVAGTRDPDTGALPAVFAGFEITVRELIRHADDGDARIRAWIAHEVGTHPARFAVPPGRPVGRWRGLDAAGHARDGGRSIGRAWGGSKKMPTRERRSLRELDEVFASLAHGAIHQAKSTYQGWFYRYPDGTTIG